MVGTPSTHRGTYPDDPDDAVAVEHGERVLGGPAEGGGALRALLEPASVRLKAHSEYSQVLEVLTWYLG